MIIKNGILRAKLIFKLSILNYFLIIVNLSAQNTNVIPIINLKDFINKTNSWFPSNLMHLGAAIELVYPVEKENKILTIEIGSQIKQTVNNSNINHVFVYTRTAAQATGSGEKCTHTITAAGSSRVNTNTVARRDERDR